MGKHTLRSLQVRQQLDKEADDVRRRLVGGEGWLMVEFWGRAWCGCGTVLSTVGGGLKGS